MYTGLPMLANTSVETEIEDVKQVILASFLIDPNTFPFNPNRGVDLDKYIFEYSDEQLKNLYLSELSDRIKLQDSRIAEVFLDVLFDEDNYETTLTINVTTTAGASTSFQKGI